MSFLVFIVWFMFSLGVIVLWACTAGVDVAREVRRRPQRWERIGRWQWDTAMKRWRIIPSKHDTEQERELDRLAEDYVNGNFGCDKFLENVEYKMKRAERRAALESPAPTKSLYIAPGDIAGPHGGELPTVSPARVVNTTCEAVGEHMFVVGARYCLCGKVAS